MVTSTPGNSLDNSVGTNVSFTCEASGQEPGDEVVQEWGGGVASPGPLQHNLFILQFQLLKEKEHQFSSCYSLQTCNHAMLVQPFMYS